MDGVSDSEVWGKFTDWISSVWPQSICKSISGLISLDESWRSLVQQCTSSTALTFELISNSDWKTRKLKSCVHLSELNIFLGLVFKRENIGKLGSRYIPQSDNIFIGIGNIVGRDKCIFRGEDSTESCFLKGGHHKPILFLNMIFDCSMHYLHHPSHSLGLEKVHRFAAKIVLW